MSEPLPKTPSAKAPITPATRWLEYARAELTGMRKWARRSASRDNVVQGLKTFAWVGPLTLLIWIYAEREQEYKGPSIVLNCELHSSDPSRIVTLQQREAGSVDPSAVIDTGSTPASRMKFGGNIAQLTVELTGPAAAVQKVKDYVDGRDRIKLEIDRADIPISLTRQSIPVDAVRLLNSLPEIRDKGVIIQRASPPTLYVYVDEMVEEERDVLAASDVTNLVGNPTFDPPKVVVRGPRHDVEDAGAQLRAYAELSTYAKKAGEQTQVPVAIRQPANSRLEFKPSSVHATFVVRESDVTGTIPSMPILIAVDTGLIDKYKCDIADKGLLYNVKVVGPPDIISALEKRQIKAVAQVYLRTEDFLNSLGAPKQFAVRFDLPDGVRPAGNDATRTVSITVTERGGTEG